MANEPERSVWRDLLEKWGERVADPAGEEPSTEARILLKESRDRFGLVVRIRWVILAIFALYALYTYFFLLHESTEFSSISSAHWVTALLAYLAMLACNAWYEYAYRKFRKVRLMNQVQLFLDMAFVTAVVHFSGGVVSWFWTMYMLLTLEAALIMENPSDIYAVALGCTVAYGGLLTIEFYRLIPSVRMPFGHIGLQQIFSYEMIKWAWVSISIFSVAFVGIFMMSTIRRREAGLRELVIKDGLTNLHNRRYFYFRLNSEIQRAKRYGRTVSLLILDLDDFKQFNDRFGHMAGDAFLRAISDVIRANIRLSDKEPSYEVDIACRYGGEEFAVILPEVVGTLGAIAAERIRMNIENRGAVQVAERIRNEIEKARIDGMSVTVSIGVSSYPDHGVEVNGLIRAAEDALYAAKRAGKNRVAIAQGVHLLGERIPSSGESRG